MIRIYIKDLENIINEEKKKYEKIIYSPTKVIRCLIFKENNYFKYYIKIVNEVIIESGIFDSLEDALNDGKLSLDSIIEDGKENEYIVEDEPFFEYENKEYEDLEDIEKYTMYVINNSKEILKKNKLVLNNVWYIQPKVNDNKIVNFVILDDKSVYRLDFNNEESKEDFEEIKDQELLENYTLEEIEEEIIYNSLEFYLKFKPIEIQNKKYVLKETIDKCCKIDKKYHKNIIKTIYSPSKAIRCLILKNKKFYQYLIIDFISIKIESIEYQLELDAISEGEKALKEYLKDGKDDLIEIVDSSYVGPVILYEPLDL